MSLVNTWYDGLGSTGVSYTGTLAMATGPLPVYERITYVWTNLTYCNSENLQY